MVVSLERLNDLIERCETAREADQGRVLSVVAEEICPMSLTLRVGDLIDALAFFQAALAMLPDGADWRKFTLGGCSLYAASPFNAAAQVRYDGHSPVDALSLTAAHLRMLAAKAAKQERAKARGEQA